MSNSAANPLLSRSEFIDYEQFEPAHVLPAVESAIATSRALLEALLKQIEQFRAQAEALTFDQTLFPLIECEQEVSRVWSPVSSLLSLQGTPELRAAADQARPLIVGFHNDLLFDARVYELAHLYSKSREGKALSGERARFLANTLRDLRLAGAGLEEDKKAELRAINLKLADLSRRFTDNVTDSKFEMILVENDQLSGLPAEVVSAAKRRADQYREQLGSERIPLGAAIINLDFPSYLPFMRYSVRSDLRKTLAFNYLQKGTENATRGLLGNSADRAKSLNNNEIIKEICTLKAQKALLLGFQNFAEVSLAPKMAKDPQRVLSFLESLALRSKPVAQRERDALINFQKEIGYQNSENNPDKIYPWDREFLSEKLRKARFNYDSQETKPYFELRQTLAGMFNLATTLFGATFKRADNIAVWHKDVEVYEVRDEQDLVKGILYLDLFPRDIKSQGAWVNPLRNSHIDAAGKHHRAQCLLVCNMTQPSPDMPSLLSFDEVETLFHEFGHALHHLLSTVALEPLSGLNVAYDFVELPSQLMENFCTEESFLKTFAKHYQTGEVIPSALLKKIKLADRFMGGTLAMRQLEFGLLDMFIYTKQPSEEINAVQIFQDIVKRYGVFDYWEGTNFPCGFSHIFGGGYSAGYYSYKWSEVLEADAYSRFAENGVLNREIGREYRDKILAKGDSEDPLKLFVDFMGREPKEDALLKRLENTLGA